MKNNNFGYTIVEVSIIIIVLSIILSFLTNITNIKNNNNIKKSFQELHSYTLAIKNFKNKYGFLPGDLKKTEIFKLSLKNTDGNANNLIEDKNQQNGIYNKNIKIDGEITNFWLHLYQSKFLSEEKEIFPYLTLFKTGILVFNNNKKNYYHLAVNGINKDNEIEIINNLTPHQAYLFDKKLDDSLPFEGIITVYSGNKINNTIEIKPNKKCSTKYEYLTVFREKLCQIIMEIDLKN